MQKIKFFGGYRMEGTVVGRFRMDGSMWIAVHRRDGALCLGDHAGQTVWIVRSYKKELLDWTPLIIASPVTLKKAYHIARDALAGTGLAVCGGKYDMREVEYFDYKA